MVLSFDVAPEVVAEHDDWHTHEHLPERLGIPGFLRGTRWVAVRGHPRYLVLYEVAKLATLASDAYLARLNHPTPWTAKLMPAYRGMRRGLCAVACSFGLGVGHLALVLRFQVEPQAVEAMRGWLVQEVLAALPARRGIGGAHLLEAALAPAMTNEQRMRGADAGVDWVLLITGYSEPDLTALLQTDLAAARLAPHGIRAVIDGPYRIDYSLSRTEIDLGS
jgi:hypothetical protein